MNSTKYPYPLGDKLKAALHHLGDIKNEEEEMKNIISGECFIFPHYPGSLFHFELGKKKELISTEYTGGAGEENEVNPNSVPEEWIVRFLSRYKGMSIYARIKDKTFVVADMVRSSGGHNRILDYEQISDLCGSSGVKYIKALHSINNKPQDGVAFVSSLVNDSGGDAPHGAEVKNYGRMAIYEHLAWVLISKGGK